MRIEGVTLTQTHTEVFRLVVPFEMRMRVYVSRESNPAFSVEFGTGGRLSGCILSSNSLFLISTHLKAVYIDMFEQTEDIQPRRQSRMFTLPGDEQLSIDWYLSPDSHDQ